MSIGELRNTQVMNTMLQSLQPAGLESIGNVVDRFNYLAAQLAFADPSFNPCNTNLKQCFEHFMEKNDVGPLKSYLSTMPSSSYKSPVGMLAALQMSKLAGIPVAVVSHDKLVDTSAHADDQVLRQNKAQLPDSLLAHGIPAVVKTVTLLVHAGDSHKRVVITALGDLTIDSESLHILGEATGISHNRLKHHSHINGQNFDPVEHLGQEPGNVGPLPHLVKDIDCFAYRCPAQSKFVAVRFTPFDTICLAREIFETVAFAYLEMFGKYYVCI